MNSSRDEIEDRCKIRLNILLKRRTDKVNRLKRFLRATKLRPLLRVRGDEDLASRCVDDFFHAVSNPPATTSQSTDMLLKVMEKKREYTIEFIAKRQLVNTRNSVLLFLKKRFFIYKKSFKLRESVSWVKDLPKRQNVKNLTLFNWNSLQLNKDFLHNLFANSFPGIIREYEILEEASFTFKMALALNQIFYSVNAIDVGEFNSLNFIFRIYKTQQYNFETMIKEIMSTPYLSSSDPAVLHDHVLSVFSRINYFNYNDSNGEMKESYENALFVLRSELFPFLVSEYLLLRFLIQNTPDAIRSNILEKLKRCYIQNVSVNNICQMYPGVFTILFLLYFQDSNRVDTKGILNVLMDVRTSADINEYAKVTKELTYISNFICEVVFNLDHKKIKLSAQFREHFMSSISFLKYNYFVFDSTSNTRITNLGSLQYVVR